MSVCYTITVVEHAEQPAQPVELISCTVLPHLGGSILRALADQIDPPKKPMRREMVDVVGRGNGPTAQICLPDQAPTVSRLMQLPALDKDNPEGLHDPACGGCEGLETSESCRYSVARREYARTHPLPVEETPQ